MRREMGQLDTPAGEKWPAADRAANGNAAAALLNTRRIPAVLYRPRALDEASYRLKADLWKWPRERPSDGSHRLRRQRYGCVGFARQPIATGS
jgi:hypothetical protein